MVQNEIIPWNQIERTAFMDTGIPEQLCLFIILEDLDVQTFFLTFLLQTRLANNFKLTMRVRHVH
jgi:hypothetical protein